MSCHQIFTLRVRSGPFHFVHIVLVIDYVADSRVHMTTKREKNKALANLTSGQPTLSVNTQITCYREHHLIQFIFSSHQAIC